MWVGLYYKLKASKFPISLAFSSHTQEIRTAQKLSLRKELVKLLGFIPRRKGLLSSLPWEGASAASHRHCCHQHHPSESVEKLLKIPSRTASYTGHTQINIPTEQRWWGWTIIRIQVDQLCIKTLEFVLHIVFQANEGAVFLWRGAYFQQLWLILSAHEQSWAMYFPFYP